MAEEIYAFEDLDGIRMPWNFWPRSKVEALKCVLPFSALYTPLKPTRNLEVRGLLGSEGQCHLSQLDKLSRT
jgi:hypothetical protein